MENPPKDNRLPELDNEGFMETEVALFEKVRALAISETVTASAEDQHRAYMGASAALVDLAAEVMERVSPGTRVVELCFLAQRLADIAKGETGES